MSVFIMNPTPKHFLSFSFLAVVLTLGLPAFGATYEKNIEKSYAVAAGGKLVVQVDRGTIEVSTEATDKVQIQVLRKVTGGSQEKADELFREHEVIFDQTGNTVSVTQKQKKRNFSINMGKPYLEVRYQIVIPRKFDVELGTSGGSIRLGDLDGAAIARTSSGSIN